MLTITNEDCMELMKRTPDKFYDLAICDPPYGLDVANMPYLKEVNTTVKQKNGTRLNGNKNKKPYKNSDWDKKTPPQEYFNELKRVSKNQIIFGIDYMEWDNVGNGRIKWDKGVSDKMSFNRYEVAYCSLEENEIILPLLWAGMCQAKSLSEPMTQQGNKKLNEKRIHPCHKPILLYKWLLKNYAKEGDKILDTHGGSMSIAIACHDYGFDLTACELDPDYYNAAMQRIKQHTDQLKIF